MQFLSLEALLSFPIVIAYVSPAWASAFSVILEQRRDVL